MKDFCVETLCPEVFEMLEGLAFKAGWVWRVDANKPHRSNYSNPVMLFVSDTFMESWRETGQSWVDFRKGTGEILTIEQAIKRLKEPRLQPIIIGGKTATFPGDGSVVIGCTTVTAEQCDEIEKRRKVKAATEYKYFHADQGINLHRITATTDELWNSYREKWEKSPAVWDALRYKEIGLYESTEAEVRKIVPAAFQEAN